MIHQRLKPLASTLERGLRRVLWTSSVDPGELQAHSDQIVLFGSRANGLATRASDWDLLCVQRGKSLLTPALDLICVSEKDINSRRWLGSELAGHIAAYGIWLHGPDDWRRDVFVSDLTVARKGRKIAREIAGLQRYGQALAEGYYNRHQTGIRRDLQRLERLVRNVAIPPTAVLDQEWTSSRGPAESIVCLAQEPGLLDSRSRDFVLRYLASA